ncbi:polyprotein [Aphelenchoides avenae]|nr:polyprotein [Aphelenchus avenae]
MAFSDARIDVSFRNLRLEVKADNSSCELIPLDVRGCHGCSRGASLEYSCRTDFGTALGEVNCPSLAFTAHCDQDGKRYAQHFLTDSKVVKEVCSMRCPNGTSTFELQATLADTELETSQDQHIAGFETASDFQWSDVLGFLQDVWSFILHSILLWDIKAWLITIAIVLVGSVSLIWLFRYVEKYHPSVLRLAMLAIIVPSVHASQRTACNPLTWVHLAPSHPALETTLRFPSHSTGLMQFVSVMSHYVSKQDGLELLEELADYEDTEMDEHQAAEADDSVLDEDFDEGNQVRLEEDLNPIEAEQHGDGRETSEGRQEAEVDIRPPPATLASVVVLPPVQRPAPLKVHSVVVTKTYKQISDNTRKGFEINGRCDREMPGHEKCRHLLLKEVDQLAPPEIRNLPIRTPLQHALVLQATRGAYGEQTNPFLRRLLRSEVAARSITVFGQFRDQRQDPTAMIKRTDLVEAMTTRFKRCHSAKEFLEKDPYLAIWYRTRCHEMAPDDIEQFRSLFGDLADALESVRTRELFPGKSRVKISAAIIGDQLADELKKSQQDGGLAITATTTAKVLESLHTYVFGASCKNLVILTGHSDLRECRKPNEIFNDCRRIVRHLERYPHLKVYWVPLPFIYDQRHSWTVLIEKMRGIGEGAPNHIFLDAFNGRSTLEFFREGNAYAMDRVDNAGKPTVAGWRVQTRFLREAVRIPITGTIAGPKRAKKRARREMNAAVRALDDVHLEAGPSRAESPTGSVIFVEPTAKHCRHFHDSPY